MPDVSRILIFFGSLVFPLAGGRVIPAVVIYTNAGSTQALAMPRMLWVPVTLYRASGGVQ